MDHSVALISTLAAALGLALMMGLVAVRLRVPALLGYLVAGIIIGPATPGIVADVSLSRQLAEIGVILLMFGVGLHFSVEDLLAVRRIALGRERLRRSRSRRRWERWRPPGGGASARAWCSGSLCRSRAPSSS